MERWLDIAFVGKAGSGKSTLAASFFGEAASTVKRRHINKNDVKIELFEIERADEMAELLETVDLVVCVMRMDDSRFRPEDTEIWRRLSYFGTNLWNKSVIALTFADRVSSLDDKGKEQKTKDRFIKKYHTWKKRIYTVFSENGVAEEVSHSIPIAPTAHYAEPKLYGTAWIGNFVKCMLLRVGGSDASARGGMWRALKDHVMAGNAEPTIRCETDWNARV